MGEITLLLEAHQLGDRDATKQLFELVYAELRQLAARRMAGSGRDQTLSTTGLVHETFLKFCDAGKVQINDQAHFYRLCGRIMRQVVTDYARKRLADKRGGGLRPVTLDEDVLSLDSQSQELLNLDEGMQRLALIDGRLVEIVEYRYFVGLSEPEVADLMSLSVRTVQRDWQRARAWLKEFISESL